MTERPGSHRQRGWAGLLSLLLALVIVGFVMRTLLRQMASDTAAAAPPAVAATPLPGGAGATPTQRAQAVEAELQRQADEARRRIDEADKPAGGR